MEELLMVILAGAGGGFSLIVKSENKRKHN